jgi:tetratricopeptide (TPR) repeat protein
LAESGGIEGLLGEEKDGAEGEAPIVGADAVALAVAMDAAKHDPGLARKAGNYLDEQQALVKLQIKHFDEEHHLAIAAAKRKRYLDRLRIVGATMLAALGVAVTGAFIMFVRDAAHDTGVVLDAASTPAPMTDRGLNGAALANELIGRLDRIHSIVAKHSITRTDEVRKDSDDQVKVEIPETGLSLQQLSRYVHRALGNQRHMSIELVGSAPGILSLYVHIDGTADEIRASGPESDLDHLIGEAAEKTFQVLDPINTVVYLEHADGRGADMLSLAQRLIASATSATDRANLLGLLASIEPDRALAVRHATIAEAIAPELAADVLMLARAQGDLGHNEQQLAALRRFIAKRAADQPPNQRESLPRLQAAAAAQIDALLGDPARFAMLDYFARSPVDVQLARRAAAAALTHDVALSRQLFQQSVDVVPPDTEDGLMARWHADVEDNDWPSALSDAQQLLARQERGKSEHPVQAPSYEFTESTLTRPWLALALAKTGNLAGAHNLIETTPTDCYACIRTRAEIAEIAGDHAESDRWFKEALHQGPSLPFAESEYGVRMLARGEPERAIEAFKAAHQKGPRFADPLKGWGDALAAQRQSAAAMEKYEEALTYAPNWKQLKDAREAAG